MEPGGISTSSFSLETAGFCSYRSFRSYRLGPTPLLPVSLAPMNARQRSRLPVFRGGESCFDTDSGRAEETVIVNASCPKSLENPMRLIVADVGTELDQESPWK